jgi:hypothetical protein
MKIPSSILLQSTGLRPGLGRSHMGYGAAVYGWGRDSGGFSTCVRRSSYFNARGLSYPCMSSFFIDSYQSVHQRTIQHTMDTTSFLSIFLCFNYIFIL